MRCSLACSYLWHMHVHIQLPCKLLVFHMGCDGGLLEGAPQAGALLAGAWFGALPPARIFGIAAAFNLAGAALTVAFVPDVLGLDLSEGDARWEALKAGQPYSVRGLPDLFPWRIPAHCIFIDPLLRIQHSCVSLPTSRAKCITSHLEWGPYSHDCLLMRYISLKLRE